MNPRPSAGSKGVYRFISARWLSGPGSSTASIESVPRLMSCLPFGSSRRVSSGWRQKFGSFRAAQAGFRVLLLTQRERNCRLFRQLMFFARSEDGRPHLQPRPQPHQSKPVHPREIHKNWVQFLWISLPVFCYTKNLAMFT